MPQLHTTDAETAAGHCPTLSGQQAYEIIREILRPTYERANAALGTIGGPDAIATLLFALIDGAGGIAECAALCGLFEQSLTQAGMPQDVAARASDYLIRHAPEYAALPDKLTPHVIDTAMMCWLDGFTQTTKD